MTGRSRAPRCRAYGRGIGGRRGWGGHSKPKRRSSGRETLTVAHRDAVITIRVDRCLAGMLEKMPNRSAFIRDAICRALARQCPTCGGTGVVSSVESYSDSDSTGEGRPAGELSQSWRMTTSRSRSKARRTGSVALVIAMMGGVLVLNSFFAQWMFTQPGMTRTCLILMRPSWPWRAILLGAPLIGHAAKHIWSATRTWTRWSPWHTSAALAIGKYQEAGVISFFVVIGNLIETRTALGARAAIESLIRLAPKNACRLMEGREEQVDIADLRPGDIIRIRPGDNIPADGKIVNGETTVNQASITGESLPVEKGIGDQAFAGTSNLTGAPSTRVTTAGEDTTLGKVQKLILQAETTRLRSCGSSIDTPAGTLRPY